jgi:hypothetical protein
MDEADLFDGSHDLGGEAEGGEGGVDGLDGVLRNRN